MKNTFYKRDKYKLINKEDLTKLENISENIDLRRSRYCMHRNENSSIHKMIICLNKKTKINLHSHIDGIETIIVINGKAKLEIYNNKKKLIKTIFLDKNNFYAEVPKNSIHTIKVITNFFNFLEIKTGPFIKNNTIYY